MSKGNHLDKIEFLSEGKTLQPQYDYIKMHFSNGENFALVYIEGKIKKIKLSTTKPKTN